MRVLLRMHDFFVRKPIYGVGRVAKKLGLEDVGPPRWEKRRKAAGRKDHGPPESGGVQERFCCPCLWVLVPVCFWDVFSDCGYKNPKKTKEEARTGPGKTHGYAG